MFYYTRLFLLLLFGFIAPSTAQADCIARITIIFTDPQMVNDMCWDRGAHIGDDGSLIHPSKHRILGCASKTTVILPTDASPELIAHELAHVYEANCPDHMILKQIKEIEKSRQKKKK